MEPCSLTVQGTDRNPIEIRHPNRSKTQCVTFKPNSYDLVGADDTGNLRQWRIDADSKVVGTMKAKGIVYAAAASVDGRWIVSGYYAKPKIVVWNAITHNKVLGISEHASHVYAIDVSNDSTRIASGSADQTIRIFDIFSGVRAIPPVQRYAAVVGVKFSPDDSKIVAATRRHTCVCDARSGDMLYDIPKIQVTKIPTVPLAWSLDGKQLFISTPGKIISFDISTSFQSEWITPNDENSVSLLTHGQFIARSAGSSVSFWDYTLHKWIGNTINHSMPIRCVSISYDGRYLACGHNKGIAVYDLSYFVPSDYLPLPRLSQPPLPRTSQLPLPRISRVPLMELSDAVLESWFPGRLSDTERILSEEVLQSSEPSHYALAARSLVRARLREWKSAIEDADTSLRIKQSHIGQIARCLALVSAGQQEAALDEFDLVFRDSDPSNGTLLLVIKSILVFACGKHKQAASRLRGLITSADEKIKGFYIQVLGNMHLKQGEYGDALETLYLAKNPSTSQESNPLTMISLIFGWNFDGLKEATWQHLCEALYTAGRIKELGETLVKMVDSLPEDEKESAHGRIVEELVTRSGQVTLLSWTGKPSRCNSCLPSSPAVYTQGPLVPPRLSQDELEERIPELQAIFTVIDVMMIYSRLTRLQPVRFAHFRLHLPCVVFGLTSLSKEQGHVYSAETAELESVEFTTTDLLPLTEPRRLVFVDTRLHGLDKPCGAGRPMSGAGPNSDLGNGSDADAALARTSIIEEVPSTSTDPYARALELIVRLGQPFNALLLLRQSDGAYKRVAAEHEIVARWSGNKVTKDVRVEVLEIV